MLRDRSQLSYKLQHGELLNIRKNDLDQFFPIQNNGRLMQRGKSGQNRLGSNLRNLAVDDTEGKE